MRGVSKIPARRAGTGVSAARRGTNRPLCSSSLTRRTPMARWRCGVTVTIGWVDWAMSSMSYSWIRDAWMAAPRAASEEGGRDVDEVDGARMDVLKGKSAERRDAMRGV